jgi:hypothetical protein
LGRQLALARSGAFNVKDVAMQAEQSRFTISPLGPIDIHPIQIMMAARWLNPEK